MIVITKPFLVVYDKKTKLIVIKSTNNTETTIGKGRSYAEFDSESELNKFITDNELTDERFTVEN